MTVVFAVVVAALTSETGTLQPLSHVGSGGSGGGVIGSWALGIAAAANDVLGAGAAVMHAVGGGGSIGGSSGGGDKSLEPLLICGELDYRDPSLISRLAWDACAR